MPCRVTSGLGVRAHGTPGVVIREDAQHPESVAAVDHCILEDGSSGHGLHLPERVHDSLLCLRGFLVGHRLQGLVVHLAVGKHWQTWSRLRCAVSRCCRCAHEHGCRACVEHDDELGKVGRHELLAAVLHEIVRADGRLAQAAKIEAAKDTLWRAARRASFRGSTKATSCGGSAQQTAAFATGSRQPISTSSQSRSQKSHADGSPSSQKPLHAGRHALLLLRLLWLKLHQHGLSANPSEISRSALASMGSKLLN